MFKKENRYRYMFCLPSNSCSFQLLNRDFQEFAKRHAYNLNLICTLVISSWLKDDHGSKECVCDTVHFIFQLTLVFLLRTRKQSKEEQLSLEHLTGEFH